MQGLDLSPLQLFQNAGPVVKGVIVVLLLASIWSWVVILETFARLLKFRTQVTALRKGTAASKLAAELQLRSASLLPHAAEEGASHARDRLIEGLRLSAQEIIVARQGRLPDLAMITSIAPFVGLFGTVWGIMTSFAAIGVSNDTSLATVAPGIAEALATTAYGLAAAIPAAVGHNRLASGFARANVSLRAALPGLAASLSTEELK
jgi:biopolymer transport protein ExbB/TolQ